MWKWPILHYFIPDTFTLSSKNHWYLPFWEWRCPLGCVRWWWCQTRCHHHLARSYTPLQHFYRCPDHALWSCQWQSPPRKILELLGERNLSKGAELRTMVTNGTKKSPTVSASRHLWVRGPHLYNHKQPWALTIVFFCNSRSFRKKSANKKVEDWLIITYTWSGRKFIFSLPHFTLSDRF